MLQVFDQDVKEQAATALWALAGHTRKQRKSISELISYRFVLDLLLSTSDKMQYVGKATGMGRDRRGLGWLQRVLFHNLAVSTWDARKFTIKPSRLSCHHVRSHEVNKAVCQAQYKSVLDDTVTAGHWINRADH